MGRKQGIMAIGLVGSLFCLALFCPYSERVTAEGTTTRAGTSSISVSLSPTIDMELTPSASGTVNRETTNLTVSTVNTEGFKVLVNSVGTTDLANTHNNAISSINTATTLSAFPNNSWGLYLGTSNPTNSSVFKPISTTPTELVHNDLANASGTYKLAIGVKADTAMPAGVYRNEIMISVVADPAKIETLQAATYMQDITSEICENSKVWESRADEVQLIDQRDGNKYWVAKLADERCWMVQNLALTFNDGASVQADGTKTVNKLTPEDSDVSTNWSYTEGAGVKMRNTEFVVPSYVASPSVTDTRSWNLGKWALATPLLTTTCDNVSNIAACTKVGFVNVSDTGRFTPGHIATIGDWQGANATSNTLVAVNCTAWSGSGTSKVCTAGTYDEHYLIGNYYQFNTATAGSGGTITNTDAKDSICPKGWQLPTAGSQADNKSESFQNVLNRYGLASAISAGLYNIAAGPFYFVRSGAILLSAESASANNTLIKVANGSGYWSSRMYSYYNNAYYLNIDTNLNPSHLTSRYAGLSVRCINFVI